ncbi:ladderlectin-like [Clupea harengus]|uniref:Ladderlectin-like n=1 Tax=Clupea harengus TaxID=7950 RepID=A0A6P8EYS7_CLUHA|nr:ladderlectin-like [Clupea harengus]
MIFRASFPLLSALLICCGATTGTEGSEQEVEVHSLDLATESDVGNSTGTCPQYWTPYVTRCFKFVSKARTWAESERYCVIMGGNLASVHSTDEYSFIQEVIRKHTDGTPRTWIGGCDAAQEKLWLWSDGSRFDYTYWYQGMPDNLGGGEHCIEMNFRGLQHWNDVPCKGTLPSVCAVQSV